MLYFFFGRSLTYLSLLLIFPSPSCSKIFQRWFEMLEFQIFAGKFSSRCQFHYHQEEAFGWWQASKPQIRASGRVCKKSGVRQLWTAVTSSSSIQNVHKDPVLKLSKHNKYSFKQRHGVLEYEYLYATLSFYFQTRFSEQVCRLYCDWKADRL